MSKNVFEALYKPPYSEDYEQEVLAACMWEGGQECVPGCLELKLSSRSFYVPAHQEIFKVCLELFKVGDPVNLFRVCERLRFAGKLDDVGGKAYLLEVDRKFKFANSSYKAAAKKVKDLEIIRNLVIFFRQGLEDAYHSVNDIDQFLGSVEQKVLEINRDRVVDTALPFDKPREQAAMAIQNMIQHKGEVLGVRSGFDGLDEKTDGFHAGEMIVLAARPSMGKTAFALNIAEAAILNKNPVPTLFFSLEMSAKQLAMRMICSHGRISMTKIRGGYVNGDEIGRVADEFKCVPFWIDESCNLTILEMRSIARRLYSQQKQKLGLVIIDYLQLLSGTDPRLPREQQIAEISRGIKGMAKELNIPVIVLSQLNRESEKEYRKPLLSDLRESGSIEQDADLVLLLSKTKESIKASKDSEKDPEDEKEEKTVSLIIGKQRNGPTGEIDLRYYKSCMRFVCLKKTDG